MQKNMFEILVQTAFVMGEFWRNLKITLKSALGTIQVLRHQRGVCGGQKMAILDDLQYCKLSKSWVSGPKKVKNMMT